MVSKRTSEKSSLPTYADCHTISVGVFCCVTREKSPPNGLEARDVAHIARIVARVLGRSGSNGRGEEVAKASPTRTFSAGVRHTGKRGWARNRSKARSRPDTFKRVAALLDRKAARIGHGLTSWRLRGIP